MYACIFNTHMWDHIILICPLGFYDLITYLGHFLNVGICGAFSFFSEWLNSISLHKHNLTNHLLIKCSFFPVFKH